ncbi:MAG: sulfite exporter TauE/SafE family protein [Spongiibacteraceae bacterium]
MITDPYFYLCAIPAVLIFGMAKGGFGGAIAVVSVPIMALVISPVQAAAILLPLLLVMDAVALWSFRGQWHSQNLRIMLPAAVAGIIAGALFFRYLSEDAVRILIGLMSLAFCLNYVITTIKHGNDSPAQAPNRLKGSFWAAISGFTSFGIHAGGPPANIYLLPQKLEKTLLMGTFAVFFAAVNALKVIPYAWLGQFDHTNLMTSLILLPAAPVGVRLGYFLLHRVSQLLIYRICYFFLAIASIKLLHDGFSNILSN